MSMQQQHEEQQHQQQQQVLLLQQQQEQQQQQQQQQPHSHQQSDIMFSSSQQIVVEEESVQTQNDVLVSSNTLSDAEAGTVGGGGGGAVVSATTSVADPTGGFSTSIATDTTMTLMGNDESSIPVAQIQSRIPNEQSSLAYHGSVLSEKEVITATTTTTATTTESASTVAAAGLLLSFQPVPVSPALPHITPASVAPISASFEGQRQQFLSAPSTTSIQTLTPQPPPLNQVPQALHQQQQQQQQQLPPLSNTYLQPPPVLPTSQLLPPQQHQQHQQQPSGLHTTLPTATGTEGITGPADHTDHTVTAIIHHQQSQKQSAMSVDVTLGMQSSSVSSVASVAGTVSAMQGATTVQQRPLPAPFPLAAMPLQQQTQQTQQNVAARIPTSSEPPASTAGHSGHSETAMVAETAAPVAGVKRDAPSLSPPAHAVPAALKHSLAPSTTTITNITTPTVDVAQPPPTKRQATATTCGGVLLTTTQQELQLQIQKQLQEQLQQQLAAAAAAGTQAHISPAQIQAQASAMVQAAAQAQAVVAAAKARNSSNGTNAGSGGLVPMNAAQIRTLSHIQAQAIVNARNKTLAAKAAAAKDAGGTSGTTAPPPPMTEEQIQTQIQIQTQALIHAHTQAQIQAGIYKGDTGPATLTSTAKTPPTEPSSLPVTTKNPVAANTSTPQPTKPPIRQTPVAPLKPPVAQSTPLSSHIPPPAVGANPNGVVQSAPTALPLQSKTPGTANLLATKPPAPPVTQPPSTTTPTPPPVTTPPTTTTIYLTQAQANQLEALKRQQVAERQKLLASLQQSVPGVTPEQLATLDRKHSATMQQFLHQCRQVTNQNPHPNTIIAAANNAKQQQQKSLQQAPQPSANPTSGQQLRNNIPNNNIQNGSNPVQSNASSTLQQQTQQPHSVAGHTAQPSSNTLSSTTTAMPSSAVSSKPHSLHSNPSSNIVNHSTALTTTTSNQSQSTSTELVMNSSSPGFVQQLNSVLNQFWVDASKQIANLPPHQTEQDFKNHNDLPLARIKRIMKSDEDVRMISAEAPVLFAKACELFILDLSIRSWNYSQLNNRRTLQKEDVKEAIQKTDIFDFLIDVIQ